MSDETVERREGEPDPLPDLELIFAPSWVRETPDVSQSGRFSERRRADADGDPRGRRPFQPGAHRERDGHRDSRGPRRHPSSRPPRREEGDRRPPPHGRDTAPDRYAPRPPREEAQPLPLEVRVLPEQKALGAIVRRIQASHRAYPMRDIARLFLGDPASCLVRIEPSKDSKDVPRLFQCRVCGMPALTEDDIREHLVRRHVEDFYDVEEVDGEPPAGNFSCVARCGLSGELLGPPNHHVFPLRVQEMLRTRFSHMTEEDYRGRIEMVRDPEVIEQWREASRRRKLYRRKPAPSDPPNGQSAPADQVRPDDPPAAQETPATTATPALERHAVELQFGREIVPTQIGAARHLVCPAAATVDVHDRRLAQLIREAFSRENRFPASLFFALRGAFRHRNLHLFRCVDARGPEFVMSRVPAPLDTSHAVADVREIMAHVTQSAGCTHQELVQALAPAGDEAAQQRVATQLNWLVEKGHVIEFFNGVLSAPVEFPAVPRVKQKA